MLSPNPSPTSKGKGHYLLTQAWCQRLQEKEIKKGFLEPAAVLLIPAPTKGEGWGMGLSILHLELQEGGYGVSTEATKALNT